MGSPPTDKRIRPGDELQHWRHIGRSFAIAAKPITKEQFLRFYPNFPLHYNEMRRHPDDTCPIGGLTWYEAAAYCNKLSEEEGILEDQWCYLKNAKGEYAEGMKMAPDYLKRTGYRLPTEAEMEYATRAGAVTSWYFGESEELLPKYGWYSKNSEDRAAACLRTWPVGSKKPNDLGFFDMHGNVMCWCQERAEQYPQNQVEGTVDDKEDRLVIEITDNHVLRGGSFDRPAVELRSAARYVIGLPGADADHGFRPARTFPTH
jgi:formylglycine-generating enzyme required for sulfatase activity